MNVTTNIERAKRLTRTMQEFGIDVDAISLLECLDDQGLVLLDSQAEATYSFNEYSHFIITGESNDGIEAS